MEQSRGRQPARPGADVAERRRAPGPIREILGDRARRFAADLSLDHEKRGGDEERPGGLRAGARRPDPAARASLRPVAAAETTAARAASRARAAPAAPHRRYRPVRAQVPWRRQLRGSRQTAWLLTCVGLSLRRDAF